MDRENNAPGHGNNIVEGINTMDKHYLKENMVLIFKLGINDTSNIGIIPSSSKEVSIKISDQCIQRLVTAQDGPFFYTRFHFSALQNCALLFSVYL